ncbi:hypothetical protein Acr_00g0068760 [Actinidia rufa]|uniref:HAT C-terminal dimerisation domain-containing protein n=1 Tax=Actinidia rufa TaxID=165716 RepID=A0A7J0DR04_9ERIC|nr:hypothetical protein Acr_00g0068760 [Actinidia rufa]
MSSSGSMDSSASAPPIDQDEYAPLWNYVTKIIKRGGGSGNTKFKCNICNTEFQGSYFRVRAHLLQIKNQGIRVCPVVKNKTELLVEIRKLDDEAETRKKMAKPKNVPLLPFSSKSSVSVGGIEDVGQFRLEGKMLSDVWWDKIDYILSFTLPMYEMLRFCDTDKPYLHLVYEMWDSMIERVKTAIYRREGKLENEDSTFYYVVHQILEERWTKSSPSLHCLAHSLNPRNYSVLWREENPMRVPPHKDKEISDMRTKCFKKYFPDPQKRRAVNTEYAKFLGCLESFGDSDSKVDRGVMEPIVWWLAHGSSAPMLQSLAVKLLDQPSSSSCCERNWSTYSFIHSMRRNKITPQRCDDLVFVHNNIRLLSRRTPQYRQGETKMWDISGGCQCS